MSANPQRAMMQFEESLRCEEKSRVRWQNRYYTPPEPDKPTIATASVSICVLGHPLQPDGSCSEILARRLERAHENWRLSQNSTVMILCGADASMFPGADDVTGAMRQILHEEYGVPTEQIYCRPNGLSCIEQAKDVSVLLQGDGTPATKSPIGVIKLITSDFNIVRARRCFGYAMKIYVSDDEVPSGLGAEDMMFMLDEEHRINHEYRKQGLYDADRRP